MSGSARGHGAALIRSPHVRSDDPRLARLRALVGKLERLPASDRRERALADARARIVDVETDEVPRVVRQVDEPAQAAPTRPPADQPEPKPKRTPARARRERAQTLRAPAVEPAAPPPPVTAEAPQHEGDEDESALGGDGLLWLEDQATDDPGADGGGEGDAPWKRGLRG